MPNNLYTKDTIAAIATPFGIAGIGIIRISGSNARSIVERVFKPKNPINRLESHHLYLGQLVDPASGDMIDEILLSLMQAPHSYTREDVVEINAHSGYILLEKILQIIINEGARLAKPGEFTFRAFLNGRIDLTQAEAVVDLIHSKSEKGLMLASRQIAGEFKEAVKRLRQNVLDILAHVEVAIDFPEDESGILPRKETALRIEKEIVESIEKIIAGHTRRRLWMDGIHTVIVGRVNAGKSSLLNRLLNEQRAIVTPIPGTTRDIIESTIDLGGIPLRLMDTAGIRKVKSEVEKVGVHLSEQKLAEADLALAVIDQSRPLNKDDRIIISKLKKENSLIIINKIDLPAKLDGIELNKVLEGFEMARISALTGEGVDDLYRSIRDRILRGNEDIMPSPIVPNIRHHEALLEASRFLKKATQNMTEDAPMDLIAVDLHSGFEALGKITGESANDEIYEKIFSEFCLGK
jgi:tRNA modification GTPase